MTDWVECDLFDRIEVFEVSLLDTKTRAFVCVECGDDVDPDDVVSRSSPRAGSGPPSATARTLPVSAPAEAHRSSRDVAWISSRHVGPHHPEIDEEIAAIKRRLGKR